jgi:hypothetical protein
VEHFLPGFGRGGALSIGVVGRGETFPLVFLLAPSWSSGFNGAVLLDSEADEAFEAFETPTPTPLVGVKGTD